MNIERIITNPVDLHRPNSFRGITRPLVIQLQKLFQFLIHNTYELNEL